MENQEQSKQENTLIKGVDYEKEGKGMCIAAIIFALLGGYLGIILGVILRSNINVNGVKYPKYNQSARNIGLAAIIISIIAIFVWNIAMA